MPRFEIDPRARTLLGDFYSGATAAPIVAAGGAPMIVAPDLGTPSFMQSATLYPFEPSSGPSLPPSFFAPSKPVIPARVARPAPVAPQIKQGTQANMWAIPPVQVVFPSQGSISTTPPAASSWIDQQMIAGVPNLYLVVGAAALAGFAMLRAGRKKRR